MIHLHHGETKAIRLETFATPWNESQAVKDEAANRFVRWIFRDHDIVASFEFANFYSGVEYHSPVGQIQRAFYHVEFVVNFPHHLLQDIFERRKPEDTAEFVDNHRQARATRAKFQQ